MQLIKSFQNASAQTSTEANIRINETAILTKRALRSRSLRDLCSFVSDNTQHN